MSRDRGEKTKSRKKGERGKKKPTAELRRTYVWRAINFYGPHARASPPERTHFRRRVSRTISSLIRDRKQNTRIYRRAVYAGGSFFPLFSFAVFSYPPPPLFWLFNCYSPHRCDIIPSHARTSARERERRERFYTTLFPPFSPELLPRDRNGGFLRRREPLERLFRNPTSGSAYVRADRRVYPRAARERARALS